MVIRHLYQRTIRHKGKKIKAWYYWFYDENGKQVRRSCGTAGKPCLLKREAEIFIASLKEDNPDKAVFNDFFAGMYTRGSPFLKRKSARGIEYTDSSLALKSVFLRIILEKFGNRKISSLSVYEIENWIITFERSNAWKNGVLSVFDDIFKELYIAKKIDCIPLIERFKLSDKKEKGILSIKEIKMLFPNSYDDFLNIWRWESSASLPEWQYFSFGVLVYTALSTGMRSGEVRALKPSQFVSNNAVLLNCMLGHRGEEIDHLKKGNDKNKKWRVVLLPDRTVSMIQHLLSLKNDDSPYIFSFRGKPYRAHFINEKLKYILGKQGINCKERNITIHSTRYTYNTIMKAKMNNVDLRLLMGHTSEAMTEYYDKSSAVDHLPRLLENKPIIDSVWK